MSSCLQPLQPRCSHQWRYHSFLLCPCCFFRSCPPRSPINKTGHPYLSPQGSWWETGLCGGGADRSPPEAGLSGERGAWEHTETAPGGAAAVSVPGEPPYAAKDHLIPYGRDGGGLWINLHITRPPTSPQPWTNLSLPSVPKRHSWTQSEGVRSCSLLWEAMRNLRTLCY